MSIFKSPWQGRGARQDPNQDRELPWDSANLDTGFDNTVEESTPDAPSPGPTATPRPIRKSSKKGL